MRISDWSSDVCSSDLRSQAACTAAQASSPLSWLPDHRRARCPPYLYHGHCGHSPPRSHQWIRNDLKAAQYSEVGRSEEHTSELQSLMRISYAVFCLKQKTTEDTYIKRHSTHKRVR